ncbi:hypothetical protein M885DRAFT_516639 [Pelagophyceae sp. CCMP2097]|nr:hypothetical protein M885DRAFT_516639 [Pelagophyceae sp. CCMP2097]
MEEAPLHAMEDAPLLVPRRRARAPAPRALYAAVGLAAVCGSVVMTMEFFGSRSRGTQMDLAAGLAAQEQRPAPRARQAAVIVRHPAAVEPPRPAAATAAAAAAAAPREAHRPRGASAAVRSRSAFTCLLCVLAALVILLPRLACGADDAWGNSLGPGLAEELLTRELRDGGALFLAWLAVGVPFDVVDRLLVRGGFPYPLTLSAAQLAACGLLGLACVKRSGKHAWVSQMKWREYAFAYVPLGLLSAAFVALTHEATRAANGGSRVAAAYAVTQGLFVIFLEDAGDRNRPATPATERRTYGAADTASDAVSPAVRGDGRRHDDDAGLDGLPGFDCACLLGMEYPPGGIAAALALLVAKVGPLGSSNVALLTTGNVAISLYFLRPANEALDPATALYLVSPVATALVAALAVVLEVLPFWQYNRFGGRWGGGVLAVDVLAFALMAAVALAVLKRFSALVLVLFALASAWFFGDVGAMVTVLGLSLWSLEPDSIIGRRARDRARKEEQRSFDENSPFCQSEFLEGDAGEKAYGDRRAAQPRLDAQAQARLGRAGLRAGNGASYEPPDDDVSPAQ